MALLWASPILNVAGGSAVPRTSFLSSHFASLDLQPSCQVNSGRGTTRWRSSHRHQSEEGVATGVSPLDGEVVRGGVGEKATPAAVEPEAFYYDELREAAAALKRRVQSGISWSFFTELTKLDGGPREIADKGEERVSEREGDGAAVQTSPKLSKKSRNSGKAARGKLTNVSNAPRVKIPIESNAPPAAILRPYLAPDDPATTTKLRPLPLPMPHLSRPLGLPRASLRDRLGLVPSRQSTARVPATDNLASGIRALSAKARVSKVLDPCIWNLRKGSLAKTIRELGRMQLTARVVEVVSWLQEHPRLWPDHTTLSTAIQVMVEAGEIGMAVELQQTLGRDSPQVAKTLALELAKIGMLAEAAGVLNYMKQSGWKIDGTVHAKVIQWACRIGGRDMVDSLLAGTDLRELNLRTQDYTSVIDSCSKLGLSGKLRNIYMQFKASGLYPDAAAYSVLMSALNREGIYEESMALFGEIERAGYKPDILAYQVMLDTCAELGNLETAIQTFQDMRKAGFEPTRQVYNTVIQLHLKLGLMLIAKHLLDEMQSRGYSPSAKTLSLVANSARN